MKKSAYLERCLWTTLALFINALGLNLMRLSCLGTESFSALVFAISERFGIPFTVPMAGINGVLLVLSLIYMRSSLGYGTVAVMFLASSFTDFWKWVISTVLGISLSFSGMEQLPLRLVLLVGGIAIIAFFCSFYLAAEIGMAPYDTLGYIVERQTGGKLPFRWFRVIQDCTCVALAILIASAMGTQWQIVGIGTVFMALCFGPTVSFMRAHVAEPFYRRLQILPAREPMNKGA